MDRYSPETIKFALLQTNYRGDINVTDTLFPEAEKHLAEFYEVFRAAEKLGEIAGENPAVDEKFDAAMDDDFNTALALSDLFGYFKAARAKIAAGDKSMEMFLPSAVGFLSIAPFPSNVSKNLFITPMASAGCAFCLPRRRMETMTLLPASRNFCA